MENASKALIIAGSIILAVLIITLGMYFYSQSAGLGKTFSMTEYEIQQHNSTFQPYQGKITGAEARELWDVVYQFNYSAGDEKLGVILHNNNTPTTATDYNAGTGENANNHICDKSNLKIGRFYQVNMLKDSKYRCYFLYRIN